MPETFTFEDAVQQPESFSFEDASPKQPESFSFEDAIPSSPSEGDFVPAIPRQPLAPEQLTTYGGPPKPVATAAETLLEPTEEMMNPRVTIPRIQIKETDPLYLTAGKEAVNVLSGLPEFMSSNAGIMGLVGGAAAPIATTAGFTADMLGSLGKQVYQSYKNWDKMTPTQKTTALTDMAGTGAFTAFLGTHLGRGIADEVVPARALAKQINEAELTPSPEMGLGRLPEKLDLQPIAEPSKSSPEEVVAEPTSAPISTAEGQQVVPSTAAADQKVSEEKVAEENNAPNVAKAETELVGFGGAVPSEFVPEVKFETVTKNAAVDRDRVDRGEPPMMDALRKGDPELWSQAMNVLDSDGGAADKLIARHKASPFIPTDVETMILLHRRVDLKNEFNKAHREMLRAESEGRGDAAESAKAVRDSMGEKLNELDAVMGKGDTAMGTMAGRAFRARQLVMNEDFSMAELVTKRESDLGRKLTQGEMAQLQKVSDDNARLNNEFAALLEAHEKNQASADMRKAVSESEARAKQVPYHPRILELAEGYAKKWDERGAKALSDLKALFGGGEGPMFSGAPIRPEMLDNAIIYGTSKIVRGAVDFAKWSDSMIRDLGPGFEKYAKQVWEASKKAFDSDVAGAFKKQGVATAQKIKGALKGADIGTETILKKIKRKVDEAKGLIPDIKYHVDKLLDYHVRQGLKEEGPLLDAIHADLQKVIPDITRRETREILAGYGTAFKPLAKDAVSVIKRDMHGQWQEISKIDMIKRGIFPPKLQERATMTDKQRWLRKQYEEQKRLHPEVTPSDAEGQLKTAMQAAKTRITNQISDLEHQIQTRTKIVKESKKLKPDAELERLSEIRDEMKAVYDTVFKKPDLTDAERLEIWKERTKDRIEELTQKVKDKNFLPKKRPDPVRLDPEAIKINFQLHKVHRALLDLRLKDQLDKRNTAQKVMGAAANLIRFSRAVITGGEFSAVLRQGAFTAGSHPIISAKALVPMFKALMSEEAQFKVMEQILTRENAPLYQRSKLELTETGMRLSNMEEHYMFRVSEKMRKIPGFGQLIKSTEAFQRAYTTYRNVIRADTFDALAETYGKDAQTTKEIANLINVATGRGSVSLGKYAQGLNTVLFAPRYSISRFQLLGGQPIWTAANKRMVVNEYAKALGSAALVYSLGMMAGGTVEVDPRSSDFGKIKMGNTRIDPMAGLIQASVLLARLASGQKKTASGKVESLVGDKKFGKQDIAEVLEDFGFNKLAPLPATAIKLRQHHDQIGQPYGMKDVLIDTVTPITYRDVYQTMKEQNIPEGTIMAVLAIFGMGIQNYTKQQKTNTSKF